jgi:hypothetical protein
VSASSVSPGRTNLSIETAIDVVKGVNGVDEAKSTLKVLIFSLAVGHY